MHCAYVECGYGARDNLLPTSIQEQNNLKSVLASTYIFGCLLEFIVPLEKFSLIWRRHHYR